MTRINFGIKPKQLTRQHLLAEHREIKRIPNAIINGKAKFKSDHSDIPTRFTLGTGHVKFFYNKIKYLHTRYNLLLVECIRRGYNVQSFEDCFIKCKRQFPALYNDATPTQSDIRIIKQRIAERLSSTPQKFNSRTK